MRVKVRTHARRSLRPCDPRPRISIQNSSSSPSNSKIRSGQGIPVPQQRLIFHKKEEVTPQRSKPLIRALQAQRAWTSCLVARSARPSPNIYSKLRFFLAECAPGPGFRTLEATNPVRADSERPPERQAHQPRVCRSWDSSMLAAAKPFMVPVTCSETSARSLGSLK